VEGVVVVPVVDVAVPIKDENARIRLSKVAKGKTPFRIQQIIGALLVRRMPFMGWKRITI
jgi:hypothetical protein